MKKIILIVLVFAAINSYGQVGKQDFETLLTQFKFESMSFLAVYNVHVYNNDGTNNWTFYNYKIAETTYELKENAFYIKWYTDNTKKTLHNIYVIPYDRIKTISIAGSGMSIDLIE
jgi:sporulation protein YlmC with PRC-barrel domain